MWSKIQDEEREYEEECRDPKPSIRDKSHHRRTLSKETFAYSIYRYCTLKGGRCPIVSYCRIIQGICSSCRDCRTYRTYRRCISYIIYNSCISCTFALMTA